MKSTKSQRWCDVCEDLLSKYEKWDSARGMGGSGK